MGAYRALLAAVTSVKAGGRADLVAPGLLRQRGTRRPRCGRALDVLPRSAGNPPYCVSLSSYRCL